MNILIIVFPDTLLVFRLRDECHLTKFLKLDEAGNSLIIRMIFTKVLDSG